jgi:hypothetical protein
VPLPAHEKVALFAVPNGQLLCLKHLGRRIKRVPLPAHEKSALFAVPNGQLSSLEIHQRWM